MGVIEGAQLRTAREAAGWSLRAMAELVHFAPSYLSLIETGKRPVTREVVAAYELILGPGSLRAETPEPQGDRVPRVITSELPESLPAFLEFIADDLSRAYPKSRPDQLLAEIQWRIRGVRALLQGRTTLMEHRRLMVVLGWLSMLAAACHVDLGEGRAAAAQLWVAREVAIEAEHTEIDAWRAEIMARQHLALGEYLVAVVAAQIAQQAAPRGSYAMIQATAQEAAALARYGDKQDAYTALRTLARLVADLPTVEMAEHRFRFDTVQADSAMATTLAWLGDRAAESFARHVIRHIENSLYLRPRRLAAARLDLGLALLAAGRPEEAAHEAMTAVTSGCLVPADRLRLEEVVTGVEGVHAAAARPLREAFRSLYPTDAPSADASSADAFSATGCPAAPRRRP